VTSGYNEGSIADLTLPFGLTSRRLAYSAWLALIEPDFEPNFGRGTIGSMGGSVRQGPA
jgi:hypothetical protein